MLFVVRSSPNRYFWGERELQIPELKLLIDAVASSRSITEKKSKELIGKLAAMGGRHWSEDLMDHVHIDRRSKPKENQNIYYTIDVLHRAISDPCPVEFRYLDYDENKKRILAGDGETCIVTPCVMYWENDFYHMIGISQDAEEINTYRIDRSVGIARRRDIRALEIPEGFCAPGYCPEKKTETVELQCDNDLMSAVIDRFGEDIETRKEDDSTFIARAAVELSSAFYAWVFLFGGRIRIRAPRKAVRAYYRMLKDAQKMIVEEG